MSNNKQSSVEWYIIERHLIEIEIRRDKISAIEYETKLNQAEQQAKAMHKEEIKEAWDNSAIDATYGNKFKNFEHYYNETFGE